MTLSAHKLGGPQGVGALVLGAGVEPAALHPGRRAGAPLAARHREPAGHRRLRAGPAELAAADTGFGSARRRAARPARGARSPRSRRRRAISARGARAPAQHHLPRHAGGRQPDPADRPRSRRHRGQHRLGLLVRQGRALARAGRDGRRGRGGADGDPGQPGLGQHRGRRGSLRRRLEPAVRAHPRPMRRRRGAPERRWPGLLLAVGSPT